MLTRHNSLACLAVARRITFGAVAVGIAALGIVGCETDSAGGDGANSAAICQQAADHLASCTGEAAAAASAECNAEQAQAIVGQSCDQLSQALEGAKADGWYDVWTSQWCGWYGQYCPSTSRSGVLEVSANTVVGLDGPYGTYEQSVRCGYVRVLDVDGKEVASAYTTPSGRATFSDLDEGEYTVELLDRDGKTQASKTVVTDSRDAKWAYLRISDEFDLAVRNCAGIRGTMEVLQCGELYPADSLEWGVRIEALQTSQLIDDVFNETWNGSILPSEPMRVYNSEFAKNYLPFGEYRLTFVRLDLPDKNNLDMTEELDHWSNDPEEAGYIDIELTAKDLELDETGHDYVDVDYGAIEVENPRPSSECPKF